MDPLPDDLINAYLEGNLTEDQSADLSCWLLASKGNARYLASLAKLEHGLVKHARMQSNRDILTELKEAEETAEVIETPMIHIDRNDPLTKSELKTALSYVFEHTFTLKRFATLVTAAALLLGVVLTIVMFTGPEEEGPIAEVPDWSIEPTPDPLPAALPTLATITSLAEAQWQYDGVPIDLPLGASLYESDRFTLAEGFVQLTTKRGVEVLLQAPCTIEMTSHDNAIRLHRGKLVAEVPKQAVGFTVHTDTARVVDFGTEFGVDVLPDGDTEVAVFTGLVELHEQSRDSTRFSHRIALSAGQASRVDSAHGLDPNIQTFNTDGQSVFVRQIEDVNRADIIYAQQVLKFNPIAYWPMMGEKPLSSASIGTDGRGLTPIGEKDVERVKGPGHFENSQAIAVNARRSFYTAGPYPAERWENNEYSLSLWVRIDERGDQNIVSFVPTLQQRGGHYSNQIRMDASGKLQLYTYCPRELNPENDSYTVVRTTSARPIDTEQWVHVAATYGDGRSRLYIDGRLVGQERAKDVFESGYPTLLIGGATGYSREDEAGDLKGAACQLAVFNRALTLKEVKELSLLANLKEQ